MCKLAHPFKTLTRCPKMSRRGEKGRGGGGPPKEGGADCGPFSQKKEGLSQWVRGQLRHCSSGIYGLLQTCPGKDAGGNP